MPCFEAAVLTRLAKRGHASIIAQEAWNVMSNDSTHPPSEVGNPGIHAEESSFSKDATAASACKDAMSDGRASHARAPILHDSRSALNAENGRHQGKMETAASSLQAPSANPAAPSHPGQAEDPKAGTDSRNSAAVMTIQRLLCQITDSQALEKILAALLLEAPAQLPQNPAQVGPSTAFQQPHKDKGFFLVSICSCCLLEACMVSASVLCGPLYCGMHMNGSLNSRCWSSSSAGPFGSGRMSGMSHPLLPSSTNFTHAGADVSDPACAQD